VAEIATFYEVGEVISGGIITYMGCVKRWSEWAQDSVSLGG